MKNVTKFAQSEKKASKESERCFKLQRFVTRHLAVITEHAACQATYRSHRGIYSSHRIVLWRNL